jgi:hypothetical protein
MKLLLCLRPCLTLGEKIAGDAALAAGLGHTRLAHLHVFKKWIDADSPLVQRVLDIDDEERPSFFRDLRFTAAEIATAPRLEVRAKVTIGQSQSAAEATHAAYEDETLLPTASGWPVRLPQRIFLSKPPAAGTIAHVDQWTGEYVMDNATADLLRATQLSGWQLQPVWKPRTRAPEPAFGQHLRTDSLLPPALHTFSAFHAIPCGPKVPPRRHGLIAYTVSALRGAPDFARTAEPWEAWDVPEWTVSQAVRAFYESNGLRGWTFWPLLEDGTALFDEHESLWGRTIERVRRGKGELFV